MQIATRLPVPVEQAICDAPPCPVVMSGPVAGEFTHIADATTSPAAHELLQPAVQFSTWSSRALFGPAAPAAPAGPAAPCGPAGPAGPTAPVGPAGPIGPAGPVAPEGPAGPDTPRSPGAPFSPVAPGVPCSPRSPFGPSKQPARVKAMKAARIALDRRMAAPVVEFVPWVRPVSARTPASQSAGPHPLPGCGKVSDDAGCKKSLDWEQKENYVLLSFKEEPMFRAVVEEAAALTSLALFVGMIAVWVQVFAAMWLSHLRNTSLRL
jgi:hypothetical protein